MLETVGTLIFFAYATACFLRFIDFCMSPGGILSWYYDLLCRLAKVETDEAGEILSARWFYYPLGGCVHCMGFWLAIFPAIYLCQAYAHSWQMYVILFFAYQGITFHFTEIQER